jgi:transcriptional regulator GlxA family with amidase domain
MRIAILAVDSMFDSGLAVTLDVLATANALRAEAAATTPPFEVTVTGIRNEVRTGHALRLVTTPLAQLAAPPDLLVMPAVGLRAPSEVVEIVRGHPALAYVAALHSGGTALAAACSGTFFLAEAGVLDGRVATTSWWLGPAFRGRYGGVRLRDSATIVGDGPITTAGAAFAHIDLALSVVQQQSPALAELTARYLLIGDRPSQAVFAVPSLLARSDPTVTAFERWVREHVAEPIQISRAAAAISVSERTLQRTTAAVLGMSPIDFVHEIRLDQATFLLRTTSLSADAVAGAVGYQNTSTLRALVRRRRGSTIGALRLGGRELAGRADAGAS